MGADARAVLLEIDGDVRRHVMAELAGMESFVEAREELGRGHADGLAPTSEVMSTLIGPSM